MLDSPPVALLILQKATCVGILNKLIVFFLVIVSWSEHALGIHINCTDGFKSREYDLSYG